MEGTKVKKIKQYGIIIIGAFLFCLGVNLFISPLGLYNGGVVGISQIIRTIIVDYFPSVKNFEIAGIINFIINIPLLLIAYKSISKKFFIRTVVSVISQTIFFTVITIPSTAIIDDPLAARNRDYIKSRRLWGRNRYTRGILY